MRRWMLIVCLLLPAGAFADVMRGAWHIAPSDRGLQFEISYNHGNRHSQNSNSINADAFRGLSEAAMTSSTETPVHFQLVRDAGTFDMTGTFLNGDGVGRFAFTPDADYANRLRSMGVPTDDITDDRLFWLAELDVSSAFIGEMRSLGYRESLDRYVEFKIHGATPDFIRELSALGFDHLPSDRVIEFRIHGVTPEYIKDVRAEGVTGLDPERLIELRIHGASIDYIRELGTLGYRGLTSEQLVQMRIHSVTPKFIRDLEAAGYHGVPPEKLVQMRIHGIDADFARSVK